MVEYDIRKIIQNRLADEARREALFQALDHFNSQFKAGLLDPYKGRYCAMTPEGEILGFSKGESKEEEGKLAGEMLRKYNTNPILIRQVPYIHSS